VWYLTVPLTWWWIYRTHEGLSLRAVGESPAAAEAAGVRVSRVRVLAIVFGGAMAGLAGGTLVLAQVGTFAEGMSAGRGFIARAMYLCRRARGGRTTLHCRNRERRSLPSFARCPARWRQAPRDFRWSPRRLTIARRMHSCTLSHSAHARPRSACSPAMASLPG